MKTDDAVVMHKLIMIKLLLTNALTEKIIKTDTSENNDLPRKAQCFFYEQNSFIKIRGFQLKYKT